MHINFYLLLPSTDVVGVITQSVPPDVAGVLIPPDVARVLKKFRMT